MKKILLAFGLYTMLVVPTFAQDTIQVWKRGFNMNVNVSQVGLSNWAGGGEDALSAVVLSTMFANYQKDKLSWGNQLDLGFGLFKQGADPDFYKSDDKIIFGSKLSRAFKEHWFTTFLVDFRTQFAPGHTYEKDANGEKTGTLISNFMAPGYLIVSPGLEYRYKDNFYAILSPITGKFTFVLDDKLSALGAFGVPIGSKFRDEYGAYFTAGVKKDIRANINLGSKLSLFTDYATFGNIDVNWEATLMMKVTKHITTSISTQLLYDDDIDIKRSNGTLGPATQFKEVINVGLLYQFGDKI